MSTHQTGYMNKVGIFQNQDQTHQEDATIGNNGADKLIENEYMEQPEEVEE